MATASNNKTFAEIQSDIKRGTLAPIYILFGEESYFIDQLVKGFESLIPEADRAFNLYSFYAQEIEPQKVIATYQSYPMMSDRQVVILRETQGQQPRYIDQLSFCAHNINPSSVLVVCYRGATKGAAFIAAAKKAGAVIFESKRLRESNADAIMEKIVREKGLSIERKGLAMLREYIGLDISKMYGEVDKLAHILGQGAMITPESIEHNIGVSKDFNNFELIEAIADRDASRIFPIINYFRKNPKSNPVVVTTATIFNYFSRLMLAFFTPDKSPSGLMDATGVKWQSGIAPYTRGMRHYNVYMVMEIISAIRELDTKSKGVGSRQNEYDLLHELMFRIVTCKGKVTI